MILIADSGSSKTDWRILSEDGAVRQAKSMGFNPFYQTREQLDAEIGDVLLPQITKEIKQIYYYGAGCSNEANCDVIRSTLNKYFEQASIEVHHDLLAAARSLCGNDPGIACILGTGTNSCFYDGENIVSNVASLGYVLGDEGSGSHLGKQLLADYLRENLPQSLQDRFSKRFDLSKEEALRKTYQEESPGKFLASFSKFIFQNLKEPYCYRLVYESFETFFKKNVVKYDSYERYPVHFTGSIAFYYSNILRQVANDLSIRVGNVIESPIAGLTLYHQNSINK